MSYKKMARTINCKNMGKINSKQKGKDGELEFAHECQKRGWTKVHRTAQCNGKLEDSLADCVGLPDIHVEVKRVEHLNIFEAVKQAQRDLKTKKEKLLPVVFHRKNREKWLATMPLDEFFELYEAYIKAKGIDKEKYNKE